MNCYVIRAGVSGKCHCGKQFDGDCHFLKRDGVPFDLVCREHCLCCTPLFTEFAGAAVTVSGEQGGLF